jgi:hypothetical protein
MWLDTAPSKLCKQHLLGLHKELHQESGTIKNHQYGEAIAVGHYKLGQISAEKIESKHDDVVKEMNKRGINHKSPLKYRDYTGLHSWMLGFPAALLNKISLANRCENCNV